MAARSSTTLCALLTTASLTATALAAEPAVTPDDAKSLPAYVDIARSAELQAAWRAHVATAAQAEAGITSSDDDVLDRTRRLIARATVTDREAAEVRLRAEELSRRFAPAAERAAEAAGIETASIAPRDAIASFGNPVEIAAEQPAEEIVAEDVTPAEAHTAKAWRKRIKRADPDPAPPRVAARTTAKKGPPFRLPPDKPGIGPAGRLATDYSNWNAFPQTP